MGIEDTTSVGDWSPAACAMSYVSIPAYGTRHNNIRKRGCEAGQCEKRTGLDWRGRELVYVYVCVILRRYAVQECTSNQLLDNSTPYRSQAVSLRTAEVSVDMESGPDRGRRQSGRKCDRGSGLFSASRLVGREASGVSAWELSRGHVSND